MRLYALAALLLVAGAGCLHAHYTEGYLLCSGDPQHECPEGSFCAANGYCYYDGTDLAGLDAPDFAAPPSDLATAPRDLAAAPDDLSASAPAPDLSPPADLLPSPSD